VSIIVVAVKTKRFFIWSFLVRRDFCLDFYLLMGDPIMTSQGVILSSHYDSSLMDGRLTSMGSNGYNAPTIHVYTFPAWHRFVPVLKKFILSLLSPHPQKTRSETTGFPGLHLKNGSDLFLPSRCYQA